MFEGKRQPKFLESIALSSYFCTEFGTLLCVMIFKSINEASVARM